MDDDWKTRAPAVLETFADPRRRALEIAAGHRHARADEAHLVAALLERSPVQRAVAACGADPDEVRALVDGTVDEQPRRRWWQIGRPGESRRLRTVYERALIHAISSEVNQVSPVALLVRVLLHAPPSLVAERLDAMGVEALPLMRFDAHRRVDDAPLPHGTGPARVVLANDPYTTMELVVELLERFFGLEPERAHRLMRRVHERQRGTIRFSDWEAARRAASAAREEARRRGYPLELALEADR